MKRLIVILSVALMAGCALALAEDSADNANTDAMNNGQTSSETTTTTQQKTARASKTCTDDNGNVLKKGDPGFRSCWKAQHPKQESGTAATEKNSKDQNKMQSDTDQSNPSNSSTGASGDTSVQ